MHKYSNLLPIVFLLSICAYVVSSDSINQRCSLVISRQVRKVLKDVVFPVVEHHDYQIPEKCVFHSSNDKYAIFADKGRQLKKKKYKCDLCEKHFTSQDYLDQHLLLKHEDKIPVNATICLADYCDILRCDEEEMKPIIACNEQYMLKRKFFCEGIMSTCFPPESSDVAHKLNELLTAQFCDPLTCNEEVRKKADENILIEKHSNKWTGKSIVMVIIGTFIVAFLAIYYIVVCVWQSELRMKNDLRRLSTNRHAIKLNLWKGQKVKGY